MSLKIFIKTNFDLILAIIISILIVRFGAVLNVSDFLQASVTVVPITLVVLSVFFAFNKKFVLAALNNDIYSKQLYQAFLTPTLSSILSFLFALFGSYYVPIYFLAVLFLIYSLFSLIDLILYLLATYTKLARHKKL
jgi:hypothetical protein